MNNRFINNQTLSSTKRLLNSNLSSKKKFNFINKFEKKFQSIHEAKQSILMSNGTAPMHVALMAADIGLGDEVIVPPLTMSSTSYVVIYVGAKPVYADVNLKTLQISYESIVKKINKKTKAIITVGLYGLIPEMIKISKLCKSKNIILIEDNAECIMARYKNRLAGTFGDFASYSFQTSKHITCGEGGLLLVNNKKFINKTRPLYSLGYGSLKKNSAKIEKKVIQNPDFYRHTSIGYNFRISEFSAAILLPQLNKINKIISMRRYCAKQYDKIFKNINWLKSQETPKDYFNTYWSYILIVEKKELWTKIYNTFEKHKIDTFYAAWKLTYQEPFFYEYYRSNYSKNYIKDNKCPNAEYLQPRIIALKTNYYSKSKFQLQIPRIKRAIHEIDKKYFQ